MPKVPHNLPSTVKHIFSTAACRTQVRPQALRNALRSNLSPQYVFGRPERLAPIHHGLRLSAHAHGEYGCCQDHAPRSAQVGIELLHAIPYHTIAILKAGIASAAPIDIPVSYTHLRAHETNANLVCRLLLEKKKITSSDGQGYLSEERKQQNNTGPAIGR